MDASTMIRCRGRCRSLLPAIGLVLALAGCGAAAECRKDYPDFDSAAFQACMRPVLARENAEANHRAAEQLRLGN